MKSYQISSDGNCHIYYEDESCTVTVTVADFRDATWWVGAGKVIDKCTLTEKQLSQAQKILLYKRIAISSSQEKVYNEKIGFIDCTEHELSDDHINLLEVQ